jgi:hypothetical protein
MFPFTNPQNLSAAHLNAVGGWAVGFRHIIVRVWFRMIPAPSDPEPACHTVQVLDAVGHADQMSDLIVENLHKFYEAQKIWAPLKKIEVT